MMGSQVYCNFGMSRNMNDSYIQNTEQIIPHPAMSNKLYFISYLFYH